MQNNGANFLSLLPPFFPLAITSTANNNFESSLLILLFGIQSQMLAQRIQSIYRNALQFPLAPTENAVLIILDLYFPFSLSISEPGCGLSRVPKPVRVERVLVVLSPDVWGSQEEPRIVDSLISESTLYLLVHQVGKPLQWRFHVANGWDWRDIHVTTVETTNRPLRLCLGLVPRNQLCHRVKPCQARPIEVPRA